MRSIIRNRKPVTFTSAPTPPFKREGLKGRNLFHALINNYKKRDVINHVPNLGFILSAATRYEPLGKPGRKSKLSAGAFS